MTKIFCILLLVINLSSRVYFMVKNSCTHRNYHPSTQALGSQQWPVAAVQLWPLPQKDILLQGQCLGPQGKNPQSKSSSCFHRQRPPEWSVTAVQPTAEIWEVGEQRKLMISCSLLEFWLLNV